MASFFLQSRHEPNRPEPPGTVLVRPILEIHLPHVYRYALRLTRDVHAAEDLAQEAIVRAWERQDQLTDHRQTRIWLLCVAANLWRDEIRRKAVRQRHQPRLAMVHSSADERSSASRVDQCDSAHHALTLLDQLPERQREVLYLSACEDLTAGEIASILDVSSRAVIASLSIARQKVREMIEEKNTVVRVTS